MYVKQHVKWPHEYVLAGNNKDCVNYNQLNITQWMAGFCRIMREEKCEESKDCMLDYIKSLIDDANNFSWQSAKASHAILLCQMEQGEITNWSETEKIDRVRAANAQRHTNGYQSSAPYQRSKKFQGQTQVQGQTQAKVTKPCHVYIIIMGLVHIRSIMRLEVFIISTFAVLALLMRADPVLTVLLNVGTRIQKTNRPGYGLW